MCLNWRVFNHKRASDCHLMGSRWQLNVIRPPWSCSGKESSHLGDLDLIPRLGRFPAGRNGNPLQYSCLENLVDRRARWATAHRVTKSRTWLDDWSQARCSVNQDDFHKHLRCPTQKCEQCFLTFLIYGLMQKGKVSNGKYFLWTLVILSKWPCSMSKHRL